MDCCDFYYIHQVSPNTFKHAPTPFYFNSSRLQENVIDRLQNPNPLLSDRLATAPQPVLHPVIQPEP